MSVFRKKFTSGYYICTINELFTSISIIILMIVGAQPVYATTIKVNSTADVEIAGDSNCTLREAINNADTSDETTQGDCIKGSAGTDVIKFDVADNATITLDTALSITSDIRMDGTQVKNLVLSGHDKVRVFGITSGVVVEIEKLTIAHGNASEGGGILNKGNLTLINSHFSNNVANNLGGAIDNLADLTVISCTFSNNSAKLAGGGIYNNADAVINSSTFFGNSAQQGGATFNRNQLISVNSTFSNNAAQGEGGGIFNEGNLSIINNTLFGNWAFSRGGGVFNGDHNSILQLKNTIIANSTQGRDCFSLNSITTNAYNLIADGSCDTMIINGVKLGPLQDNGGFTKTHALLEDSVAINAGDSALCKDFLAINNLDQRGVRRVTMTDNSCDIGAFEFKPDTSTKSTYPIH